MLDSARFCSRVPLATLLLAVLKRREHVRVTAVVGALVALAGIAVMSRAPLVRCPCARRAQQRAVLRVSSLDAQSASPATAIAAIICG